MTGFQMDLVICKTSLYNQHSNILCFSMIKGQLKVNFKGNFIYEFSNTGFYNIDQGRQNPS